MNLRLRVIKAFRQRFGTDPDFVALAPGRVNLLGEHVDYNEGFVLPAAIDLKTQVAFRKSGSSRSTLLALDLNEEASFDFQSVEDKLDSQGRALPFWAHYPAGMLWSLNTEGLETPGMEAVYASDVPRGAGLSSSASVEMAFGIAWEKLGGWKILPLHLAEIGLRAEISYVGLNCGIMDQFSSACGEKDRLLFLDCRSLDWRTVRLPEKSVLIIADTTVRRSLTDSSYNERRTSCEEAVRILKKYMPQIISLRDVSIDKFRQYSERLPVIVARRTQHVIEEIARTKQAVDLLEKKDTAGFGKLMNACHTSLRDLYEVSCPELDTMAALAQSLPGCYGARLTGAGFGGCTVNLVAKQAAKSFTSNLSASYLQETGLTPDIHVCRVSDGASVETCQ